MSARKNFAQRLRIAMRIRNSTLTEFSDEVGIGKSTLHGYFKGTSTPSLDTVDYIAEHMGCSAAELISDPEAEATLYAPEMHTFEHYVASLHPQLRDMAGKIRDSALELQLLSDWLYAKEAAGGTSGEMS